MDLYPITEISSKAEFAKDEFEKLSFDLSREATTAVCELNRSKNRYVNIIPYDYTRVKLGTPNDYINASYINGLVPGSERAYVATQGPIPRTMEDFWRMVWEQQAKIIVMLGKEIENLRVKIDRYWPDEVADHQTSQFGPFTVTLEKTTTFADNAITIREIRITLDEEKDKENSKKEEETSEKEKELPCFKECSTTTSSTTTIPRSHVVYHCQYSGWPDHDVPESTNHIRLLINVLHKKFGDSLPKPIVLHCSAGVGRSGTFCTVHMVYEYFIKMINEKRADEIRLNVFKIVSTLREQRPGMVQQLRQYQFCYQVIHDIAVDLGLLKPAPSFQALDSSF